MNNIKYTSDLIQNVIDFLTNNKIPKNLSRGQFYRFKNRFSSGKYKVKNGKLFFGELEVIPSNNKDKVLMEMLVISYGTQQLMFQIYISFNNFSNFNRSL